MPASICDPVSNALRLSLTADESKSANLLDSRIYSSAKNVLLSKIEFEASGDYQTNVLDGLKTKYVVIRPKKSLLETKILKKDININGQTLDHSKNGADGLPIPRTILFPVEKVQLGWQGPWSAGSGLQNVGNTCYLNSTLQALFHVPAFANWLVSGDSHPEKCNQQDDCIICSVRGTLMATQKSGGSPVKPWNLYSKLKVICKHITPGRQEDAHEFLRYLVEAMEKCYLSNIINSDKLDQYSKETTPLNQILGGYLRSTVNCMACQHLSTTFQHFQDILLDIRKHSTLDEALDSFFSRERLEDLGYKCEGCNKKVSATKQFYVEQAPMVLCIALKRFSLVGGKLSKHVQFRKKITLSKYMHNKNKNQPLTYKLVSVVTHFGQSQNCGHYTAIGQAPNNNYYHFDDSCVRHLSLSSILGTNAYIMFYEKYDSIEDINEPSTSTNSIYGGHASDILNREKSPLKLTIYNRNDERKLIPINSTISSKSDMKPVILNATLGKATDASCSNSEPWVVKQNGEVEKVTAPRILNGIEKTTFKLADDKKISFIVKKTEEGPKSKIAKTEFESNTFIGPKLPEKLLNGKLPKQKSPLEKLEEQMNKGSTSGYVQRNGTGSKLVPYDSESSSDERSEKVNDEKRKEEKDGRKPKPSRCQTPQNLIVTTKGMNRAWTVSSENSAPLLSPSLNGDTIKKLKDKDDRVGETEESPITSVSSLSPLSEREVTPPRVAPAAPRAAAAPPVAQHSGTALETTRHLQGLSHRGYGAPVSSWNGTHSHLSRQVFEERRDERKRALSATDEMDCGRAKKVKKFHHYNRFHNNRHDYNPFQETQNKMQWGNNFRYNNERRPSQHYNRNHNNKYKRFNRFSNGGNYRRH